MNDVRRRYVLLHDPYGFGPWFPLLLMVLFGVAVNRLVNNVLLWWCERGGESCAFEYTGWRWSPYVAVVGLGTVALWMRPRNVYDITP